MSIFLVNLLVLRIDDDRGTESGIQIFAKPHTHLLGSSVQPGILWRVGAQQDSMRAGYSGKKKGQAECQ